MNSIDASWLIGHLADAAVRGLLPAAVAGLFLTAFRLRHAALRLSVWTAVLYSALAMPFLGFLLPAIPVHVKANRVAQASAWLAGTHLTWQARRETVPSPVRRLTASAAPSLAPSPLAASKPVAFASAASNVGNVLFAPPSTGKRAAFASGRTLVPALTKYARWALLTSLGRRGAASLSAAQIALGVYALVLAFLLGRLATGMVLSHRLRRASRSIDNPGALRWLRWHALAMGVERTPVLMESAVATVPLTLGAWRPVILLPAGWRDWESTKLSAVIAHELSHVRRKDARTRALALAYRSVFWFSPVAWWLEGHLAALSEQASDLAAIGAGAEPTYYAEVLMSFFGAVRNAHARVDWQGIAMARPGARGRRAQDRIEKVLSSKGRLDGRSKTRTWVLAAMFAVPFVYLAAATRPVLVASPAIGPRTDAQLPAPPAPPPAARAGTPAPPPTPAAIAPVAAPEPPPAVAPVVVVAPRAPMAPAWTWKWRFPKPAAALERLAAVAPPALPGPSPVAAPAPPPARFGQQPEPPAPPEPPEGGDDGDWTINNVYAGMTFAVVSGKSVMMNGSADDSDTVRALQKKIGGDFIWFVHSGNSYIIRDAPTVQHALQLYAPMEELGRQQDELGRQQDELGRKQDELGNQQDTVRVRVPNDLEARLKKVEDEIRRLGPTATQDDLGRLQGEFGDLQGYLGDLQGKAGDAQGDLGRRQGELGAQQGELGRKQGELGRRQGEIAREAAHKMQDILKRALADGKAERAPE